MKCFSYHPVWKIQLLLPLKCLTNLSSNTTHFKAVSGLHGFSLEWLQRPLKWFPVTHPFSILIYCFLRLAKPKPNHICFLSQNLLYLPGTGRLFSDYPGPSPWPQSTLLVLFLPLLLSHILKIPATVFCTTRHSIFMHIGTFEHFCVS